jgi:hypothetical protein
MARTPKRFTDQTDTPNTKAGGALKLVRVNAGETALEFVDAGSGHVHVPQSATLARDVNGNVESVSIVGGATWTISRNPNSSVASLTDTVYLVEVDRDGSGIVTGVTATEL